MEEKGGPLGRLELRMKFHQGDPGFGGFAHARGDGGPILSVEGVEDVRKSVLLPDELD
jgi:hypothetical protein